MEFEWDDDKSEACFQNRGVDFHYAIRVFADRQRVVIQDRRRDYGEDRYRVPGMIDRRAYAVVYTMRGAVFRIISARKANVKEVERHEHYAHQG